jgi:hypothetical protein
VTAVKGQGGRPMLALPAGPIGRDEMAMAAWPRAGGTWAAFERDVAAALAPIVSEAAWESLRVLVGAEEWDVIVADDEHLWLTPLAGARRTWARVRFRVSVEVLDGVL